MTLTHTQVWVLILGCAVLTGLIKAFGPVLLGGRQLPPAFTRVVVLMAPTLLCALVVTSVFASAGRGRWAPTRSVSPWPG